ncbi:MAG: hypothetical protein ACR2NZ_02065 [Rubripirellula sp.]
MSVRPFHISRRSTLRSIAAAPFAVLLLVSSVVACNIPVFRYALERWNPDQCEIEIFHDGPLTEDQRRAVETLQQQSSRREGGTALLHSTDVRQTPTGQLWESIQSEHEGNPPLPYMNVRMQLGPGRIVNAWHGPLSTVKVDGIFDSPVRRELSDRLLKGHSVVWVLLGSNAGSESEKAQRDLKVRNLLVDHFETLSESIELPEGIGLPGSELHSEVPLLLKFSLLEIDPQDPQEAFLVSLFSRIQPQAFSEGEPLLIPVFGRGRALEVIPASTFNARLMEDLTVFLSGACSCQVKEQNPGFDLLMSVDWDAELFGEGVAPPPERTTRDREKPVLLTVPPGR